MKGATQFPRATWVVGGEFCGVEAIVSDVATATPRDLNLSQRALTLLVDSYLCRWIGFSRGDRSKIACGAAANDCDDGGV